MKNKKEEMVIKSMGILILAIIIGGLLNDILISLIPRISESILLEGLISIVCIGIIYNVLFYTTMKKDLESSSDLDKKEFKANSLIAIVSVITGMIIFDTLILRKLSILTIVEESSFIYILYLAIGISIIYQIIYYFHKKKQSM